MQATHLLLPLEEEDVGGPEGLSSVPHEVLVRALVSRRPGGSVIIIIIIRTGSQMENKLHENVSKKIRRSKEHTG